MKQKIVSVILLLSILMAGCGSADVETVETLEVIETVETTEADVLTEQEVSAEETGNEPIESTESADAKPEKVEYAYEDLYLSVEIPDGWEYEIKTAEEAAVEDGLVLCAIEFWSVDYPDTVFELGYQTPFGLCLTGVTIEAFTLDNGLGGYRYTELMDDIFWMNITFNNPLDLRTGGTYVISATPELTVWETLEASFKQILETVWVGPRAEN